jgi:ribosomal protein L7Ae-like RNA K-turn-binding protein
MNKPIPPKHDNWQRCALTGEAALPSALLCFVLDPTGRVVFDFKQNLPVQQRLWLTAKKRVVEQACAGQVFVKLGENASCPADLPEKVQHFMLRHMQETLHLLRRSGALVSGFEKVKQAIVQQKAVALVQAGDASADGREKLAKLAMHHHIPVITHLQREALAAITGQENQAHLAVLHGGLAAGFIEESKRLAVYCEV